MTMGLGILAILIALFVYGIIARKQGAKISTVDEFFAIVRPNAGVVTLTAASLTMGTGFVYLTDLSKDQALFAALTPFGVWLGYAVLAKLVSAGQFTPSLDARNVIHLLRDPIGTRNTVFVTVSLLQIATYTLIIAFEVYLSAIILSEILFAGLDLDQVYWVAGMILFVATFYTIIGGYRGVVATDWLQASIIIGMIAVLYAVFFYPTAFALSFDPASAKALISITGHNQSLIVIVTAIVTAVATQIYSAVNTTVGSNFGAKEQDRLFRRSGLVIALLLLLVIGLGLVWPGKAEPFGFAETFTIIARDGNTLARIATFVLIFGLLALLLSSVDSVLISVAQILKDNLLVGILPTTSTLGSSVLTWKVVVGLVSLNAAVMTAIFILQVPNFVSLLLASLTGLASAAPLVAVALLLRSRTSGRLFLIHNSWFSLIISFAMIAALVVALYDSIWLNGVNAHYVTLSAIAVSTLVSTLVYFRTQQD